MGWLFGRKKKSSLPKVGSKEYKRLSGKARRGLRRLESGKDLSAGRLRGIQKEVDSSLTRKGSSKDPDSSSVHKHNEYGDHVTKGGRGGAAMSFYVYCDCGKLMDVRVIGRGE